MPLLHRHKSGSNHSAQKEAKEHQIAEEELARGNIKQWHRHEAKAHRAGSHVRGVSLAPGTEFAGTPIGNYPAGYPMGGPSPSFGNPNAMSMGMGGMGTGGPMPTMGRLPNGQMVSIAPLNGGPGNSGMPGMSGMSGFPNGASPQQIGAAMQGGTAFGSGMNGLAPVGGVKPGYGGPNTPAAAMRNMNSPRGGSGGAYHNYPTHGSSMTPSDPYSKNANSYGRDNYGRDKYDRDYRSRRGSWDDSDSDDYSPSRSRRGRSRSSYLPNSYSDNAMYGRGMASPMGLPSSYSMGADPSYDYPVARGGHNRHTSGGMGGMGGTYLPMNEEIIIGGPVSGVRTEYTTDMLPPQVIVEGPAGGLVSSGSSSMGLTPSGTTTTTVLPPVPAGGMAGAVYASGSFPNSIPSIIEDDGMQMLPPTIVDENGMTIQAGVGEQEIYTMMSQMPGGMSSTPPMYAADSTSGSQSYRANRQDYQVDLYRGEDSYEDRSRRELDELEREVPALVDRMVALRDRLDVHEPTVRRGMMDMPGIPRASSSRLSPDLQQVELSAVRQLQAVDASRVAALEDELLLLRRQVEDPQGVESRSELRRLESRQSQLFARKSEEESEVSRLTALRQQELARLRQMKRLATMIEEQHEEEQRTLADLQRRSMVEDQRLNDIEEELAFHRTQLRSADAETRTNMRRMDDVGRSLSGEVRLSKSSSQGSRVVTPLIDEPESPARVPRQW